MARTKRAQVMMDPDEYARLEEIAEARGCSVAELFRTAVRERFLTLAIDRLRVVKHITSMEIPVGDWNEMAEEIEQAHHASLP